MTKMKKQTKLTQLFRKKRAKNSATGDDCEEIQEEICLLEKKLREKHNELFQIQRNLYRHQSSIPQKKAQTHVRPQKIVVQNSIEKLKRDLMLMSMLSGMEVQSFVADEYCCILYHIQCDSQHEVKHGLRINLQTNDHKIEKLSMPVGFDIEAVVGEFEKLMLPECLGAIRKGLVAYYDRLEQYEALKKLLVLDAQLFRVLDTSHMEVTFAVQSRTDQEEDDNYVELLLSIDYNIYDIRPKSIAFRERGLPEGMVDVLNAQCAVFKKKPLAKAFKEAFLKGIGRFSLVRQLEEMEADRRSSKRIRPNKRDYNNDDTFLPEDCSEPSDEDADDQ